MPFEPKQSADTRIPQREGAPRRVVPEPLTAEPSGYHLTESGRPPWLVGREDEGEARGLNLSVFTVRGLAS